MDSQDKEILNEFVSESREHLSDIESDLLAMEEAGENADDELINRVFRAIHTVKGASGFFGLQKISKLSHTMENVLMKIRDRELPITSERIDILLNASDLLKGMIDDIDNSDAFDIDEAVKALESSLANTDSKVKEEGKDSSAEDLSPSTQAESGELPPEVQKALAQKGPMNLYHFNMDAEAITSTFEKESSGDTLKEVMSQVGEIVHADPLPESIRRGNLPYPEHLTVYYASILEPDVLAITFGINENDIHPVEQQEPILTENPKPESKEIQSQEKKEEVSATTPQLPDGEKIPESKETVTKAQKPSKKPKTSAQPQQDTIRVNVQLLTRLMDLAGELVLGRNQLLQTLKDRDRDLPILHTLSQRVTELQEHVMQTRMQPVGNVFNKFPRIVRDMSKKVNKKIRLIIEGNEVELDRSIIEVIGDPLTHLIRNSVDHGIESPEERVRAGKEPEGTIWLRAYQEGGQVNIEIQDDGKGINPEVVRAKAIERGVITPEEAEKMSNKELINLIFLPGFSTAEKISDISGRGVGMDVVKTNFEKFGGVIELNSEPGKGTTITVRLPLTLAIIPSIITKVGNHRFAIPQVNLEEIVRVKGENEKMRIERVKGHEVLRLRGHLLPLVRLSDVLKIPRTFTHPETKEIMIDRRQNIADRRKHEPIQEDNKDDDVRKNFKDRRKTPQILNVLVLKLGGSRYGLIVDQVLDTEEIVVKPLSSYLKSIACFSGTTIMGDGKVAMILDIQGIARMANLKLADIEEISKAEEESILRRGMLEKQYVLIFSVHEQEAFALPMSMVARLEKIAVKDIETVGEKEFIQLRGASLPLIRLERYLPIKTPTHNPDSLYVIVPRMIRHPIGIIATQVIDVLETTIDLDTESIHEKGFLGTVIIAGRTMPMLDLFALFEHIDPEQKEIVESITHKSKPARILLVEDTPFFMKLTRKYLESVGYQVVEAQDGAKALEILHTSEKPFDLVVSDIEMPIMDGYELIQRIRKDEKLKNIPAMALTALSDEGHRAKGLSLGFNEYETKIDKARVLKKVHDLLAQKRQTSAA